MPIPNYSVLKGKPTAGKVVSGRSNHYQITVQAAGGPFTVAVNIQSVGGSEVLYVIDHLFTPPDAAGLTALTAGMHALPSRPGGLALDFVREQTGGKPMVTKAQMTLLPQTVAAASEKAERQNLRAAALKNAVTTLLDQAVAAGNATVYAFGSSFANSGRVIGIHDIHMNQGNPAAGGFGKDNGVWQDGALFLNMPSLNKDPKKQWVAIFIAFQTQVWTTDSNGNPVAG